MTTALRATGLALALSALAVACGDDGGTGPDVPTPVIADVAPAEGTVGTEVRIDGTGLVAGSRVFFDDAEAARVLLQGGSLFAVAPAGLQAGSAYDVKVSNAEGVEAVDTAGFLVSAPVAARVNGVTKPRGLEGMTLIVEGWAFGDSLALSQGKVFFEGSTGAPIEAPVADAAADWSEEFIVTKVPQGIADTSRIWVETVAGASDSVEFRILQSGQFSPSLINWTATTPLPEPLQGLGAAFVPVEEGSSPANYVFAVGGADATNTATAGVYRATVEETGALAGAWSARSALPEPRAYHATAAATAFTAALDTATTAAFLYVLGGVDASGAATSTVYVAEVGLGGTVGTWRTTTPLPEPLHSADAVLFRGFLYLAGGADAGDGAVSDVRRAPVLEDGSLGDWEPMPGLPGPVAYGSLVNFGPFVYSVGGETATSAPVRADQTGTETDAVRFARIDLRDGSFLAPGWSATESMGKSRSKHGTVFAGGALFVTSGIYAGQPGSSENTFAVLNSSGTLQSWQGATGAETIAAETGTSVYNQALVTFIDADGTGHLLVLGGADRSAEGTPTDAVVRY